MKSFDRLASCTNCDSDPKIVFVDYEGNLLETKEQVDLFFKDKRDELEEMIRLSDLK